jgi:hypothetical protein
MVQTAETIWRDFVTYGVPASGAHDPRKVEIREWAAWVEAGVLGGSAGAVVFASKSAMDASLGYAANTMAWVLGDGAGIYQKTGASGSGSWVRRGDLPYSFVRAANTGAGTANAIAATTSLPVPAVDGAALITVNVTAENTGPATVSFDGAAPLNIVTSSGNPFAAGYGKPGMLLAGFKEGTNFRLLTDVASAAIAAAAEASASLAQAAAQAALDAMSSVVLTEFATKAAAEAYRPSVAQAFVRTAFYDSDQISGSGALYKSNGTSTGDLVMTLDDEETEVGYDIAEKVLRPEMFGAKGSGLADDRAALVKCFSRRGKVEGREGAVYAISSLLPPVTEKIIFDGHWCKFTLTTAYPTAASGESLIRLQGARSEFKNFEMEYPHGFDATNIFGGVHGVMIEANYVRVEEAEIYGFSARGVRAGPGAYVKRPVIKRVNSHHNRGAGVMFDNTEDGVVKYCELNYNGLPDNGSIGYGFANNSAGNPINTKLLHNTANYNYRKGLDAHGGTDGQLIGNRMRGNRTYGVAILGVKGRWTLKDNHVWDMQYNPTGTAIQPVLCAFALGQEINTDPTSGGDLGIFHLEGNMVWNFCEADYTGDITVVPLLVYGNHSTYTAIGNDFRCGYIRNFILAPIGGTAGQASPFDLESSSNTFVAATLKNFAVAVTALNFRKLAVNDNNFVIAAGSNLGSLVRYELTPTRSERSVEIRGNSATLPSIVDANHIGFPTRRGTYELIQGNYVNGRRTPDFNGRHYELIADAAPAWGAWAVGDRVRRGGANAAQTMGWRCTVAGSPGTWTAEANMAA